MTTSPITSIHLGVSKYAPVVLPIATTHKSMPGAQITLHDGGRVRRGRDYALSWCFEANAYCHLGCHYQ
jgi:hypothetical protein